MADTSKLEATINRLNESIEAAREATREAHTVLRDLKQERREIEVLLTKRAAEIVDERISVLVKKELDELGPKLRKFTSGVYDQVGGQIDKLIDLAMGKEYSTTHNREDLRPLLASKIKEWVKETLADDPNVVMALVPRDDKT